MRRLWLIGAALTAVLAIATPAGAVSHADMGIWGYAVRQPIQRGETTMLKFVVKNNGPDGAHGVWLQTNVPPQMRILRWRLYGGLGCTVKGTFVRCRLGAFALEQQATVLLSVRGVKRGTWITEADVYSRNSVDVNEGNGQVRATIMVQ